MDLAGEMFNTPQHQFLEQGLSISDPNHAGNIKKLEDAIKGYEFEESSIKLNENQL